MTPADAAVAAPVVARLKVSRRDQRAKNLASLLTEIATDVQGARLL
jgi:hypothetical protein